MIDSYSNCETCPLKGQPTVMPSGVGGSLAVVGEAPGKSEVNQGKPFVGVSGRLLRETLNAVGIDPSKIWITNTCLCRPPGNATPSSKAIDACRPRLLAELREKQVTGIVMLGNSACEALLEGKRAVSKIRGRYYWVDKLGVNAVATYHPAALLYDTDLFRDMASDLELAAKMPSAPITMLEQVPYKVCCTPSAILLMIKTIYDQNPTHLACDLETTSLDEATGEVLSIGIAANPNDIFIVPNSAMQKPFIRQKVKALLEDADLCWVGQNGYQFDAKWLRAHYDIDWRPSFDTMLAHFALDERKSGHDLKTLARLYFQARDYADNVRSYGSFSEIPLEILYQYQALDCYYTWQLVPKLHDKMVDDDVVKLHDYVLLPVARALGHVEQTGVLIDKSYLIQVGTDLAQQISTLTNDLRASVGPAFNPNSPQQVLSYLRDSLKLRVSSTDASVLETIKHPFAKMMLRYRHTTKLKSTYVDAILEHLDANDRIHCDYLMFGTRTNRISSANPNLQNIPIRVGPLIRNAFTVPEGYTWVSLDYSQLELRVAAYYSQDEAMLEIYRTGQDLHKIVAAAMYRIPIEQVTRDQRQSAKVIDFGMIYGKVAKTIAVDLSITVKEAERFIATFFKRFPRLHQWIKEQQQRVLRDGYTVTPFGAKRRFPCILDSNRYDILKQAVNTPIQGFAGQICLTTLARLQDLLDPSVARILLTVHDSIELEVKTECVSWIVNLIKREAESCSIESPVKFEVEIKTGQKWGSLQEISC